jgi:hypothetical protein
VVGTALVTLVVGAGAAQAIFPSALSSTPITCAQANDRVIDIQVLGSTAYIAGSFTQVRSPSGTTHSRAGAAAFDTRTCEVLPWNPSVGGDLLAIAATSGAVYLGGEFDRINGVARKNIASVSPTTGALTSFSPRVQGKITELATSATRLYAAGGISSVDGVARGKAAAFSLATGALDPDWRPVADRRIDGLAVSPDGTRVYLGGLFDTLNGTSSGRRLAAVNPVTGALITSFVPGIRVPVFEIRASADRVAVAYGGGGGQVGLLTLSGSVVASGRTDGNVQAVAVRGTEILGGGHFGNVCSTNTFPCSGVRIDRRKAFSISTSTSELSSWNPSFNSTFGVWALAYDPSTGRVFAGGDFTKVGSRSVAHLAAFQP